MSRSSTKPSTLEIMEQIADDFVRRQLVHHYVDSDRLEGRVIEVGAQELIHFGSCSYMGLETHPTLIEAVQETAARFGTQFSSSRAYIALRLYEVLEARLREMFGKPVVVTSTTTLGHLAALPTLVGPDDAVIVDLQAHHSMQLATQQLKAQGIPLHVIQHSNMAQLERKIRALQGQHARVWYLADGVYSMFGDVAPMDALVALMDRYDCFYTYIDDAHGMGWAGERGVGVVRSLAPHHDKMVLVVSLNKSFASAGGALVLPNEAMAERVRRCGGPMIFSGPIQPPMLGAALASAELHLSPQLDVYQAELRARIDHTNAGLAARGLPQYAVTDTPLFFIPMGLPRVVSNLVHRVIAAGFYVNTATFPATPMRQGGLRFMVNRHHRLEDLDALLDCVAHHYPLALAEEGSSEEEVAHAFKIAPFHVHRSAAQADAVASAAPDALSVERADTIDAIDAALWDGMFGGHGTTTHSGLRLLEEVFCCEDAPERERWGFGYVIVRDAAGHVVLATVHTTAQVKDDMLSPAHVSRQIEALRQDDPDLLTSRAVMLGGLITRGKHLHLDRAHPQWQEALGLLLAELERVREAQGANTITLREFDAGEDEALRRHLLDQGFVEQRMGDALVIDRLDWDSPEAYLAGLRGVYRYNVRKEILAHVDRVELVADAPQTPEAIDACHALYRQVHARSHALNVFALPRRFFAAMCAHPDYDVLRLYARDEATGQRHDDPAAVMFSHVHGGLYAALIVGLDDALIHSHHTYKQILYQTVQRARALGCHTLDLAFTADLEKKKLGARPRPITTFVQAHSHLNQMVIASMG